MDNKVWTWERCRSEIRTQDDMLNHADCLIEADSAHTLDIWRRFSREAETCGAMPDDYKGHSVEWVQYSAGFSCEIGTVADRPIYLDTFANIIEGNLVVFYNGCSQLVDHLMIEEFLEKKAPCMKDRRNRHSDAMNAGRVISFCREHSKL